MLTMRTGDRSEEEEWWVKEYAEDIHDHLRKKELKNLPYQQQSPQLLYRRALVEYLGTVCSHLNFCLPVKHLAVYYLDAFMDNHNIKTQHLQLVTIGCLIVAVKVDENDSLIPKMSEFKSILCNKYQLREFVDMEMSIMEFLRWELLAPTAVTFVDYYILHSVHSSDHHGKAVLQSVEQAKNCVEQYTHYFLNLSILDYTFRQFLPSIVASACIGAARVCLQINPMWPDYLKDLTRYDIEDIGPCLIQMISLLPDNDTILCRELEESTDCDETDNEEEVLSSDEMTEDALESPDSPDAD